MRASRLIAIIMLLQAHEQLTAGEIAGRLGVSDRTVRRDLDVLGELGVPLYSERGHGGGWRLVHGWRSDLSGLTADEAHGLFLVAGSAGRPGLGLEPAVDSALRKLLAALPAATRPDAEAVTATLLVDPGRWGGHAVTPPAQLAVLAGILRAGHRARVRYAGRAARAAGEPARDRDVDPYGLVQKGDVWYLVAGTDAGPRTLRVSRIESVTKLDEPAHRPADLDLPALWAQSRRAVEERMWAYRVRLRADPAIVPILLGVLGARGRLEPPAGPPSRAGAEHVPAAIARQGTAGWTALCASFPSAAVAAADLAGFGARVVVDESPGQPDGVAAHLRRIATELLAQYSPRGTADDTQSRAASSLEADDRQETTP
ncbi:helix-turn-helix transcriptional regulator [Frankia gtarii]|uniref:helix-turn-helix transcriptional regulator n=2 Tax=Frankia TaxID=1854 RepID=UPI0021C07BB7|nr:WYL domain-containing protein [Frankia gtarii]